MINKFSKKGIYRSATYLIIMLIVTGFIFFRIYSEREAIANQVDDHQIQNIRNSDLLRISKLAKDNPELVNEIKDLVQTTSDPVDVIEALESIGKDLGVKINIVNAERGNKDGGGDFLNVNLEAVGSWGSVYKFVKSMDTFVYKHATRAVSFNIEEGKMWKAEIQMTVFLNKK
jgi:hypothetical protein